MFTAKPGTHFVIRCETYRMITKALAANGIYFAHRKVIVEMPGRDRFSGEEQLKVAEAVAAAGMAVMQEDDKESNDGNGGSTPGLPYK